MYPVGPPLQHSGTAVVIAAQDGSLATSTGGSARTVTRANFSTQFPVQSQSLDAVRLPEQGPFLFHHAGTVVAQGGLGSVLVRALGQFCDSDQGALEVRALGLDRYPASCAFPQKLSSVKASRKMNDVMVIAMIRPAR